MGLQGPGISIPKYPEFFHYRQHSECRFFFKKSERIGYFSNGTQHKETWLMQQQSQHHRQFDEKLIWQKCQNNASTNWITNSEKLKIYAIH